MDKHQQQEYKLASMETDILLCICNEVITDNADYFFIFYHHAKIIVYNTLCRVKDILWYFDDFLVDA